MVKHCGITMFDRKEEADRIYQKETRQLSALWRITLMAARVCCNQRSDIAWDNIMAVLKDNGLTDYWELALKKCEDD